jgi:hypothetical protein
MGFKRSWKQEVLNILNVLVQNFLFVNHSDFNIFTIFLGNLRYIIYLNINIVESNELLIFVSNRYYRR